MHHRRLQTISPVPISTNWSHPIYSISSSKGPLKITLFPGWANILLIPMARYGQMRSLMILINGMTHPNIFSPVLICDLRIAAAPPFSGLRCFPQGRGFKQWTGDDSKAPMKVISWLLFNWYNLNCITTDRYTFLQSKDMSQGMFCECFVHFWNSVTLPGMMLSLRTCWYNWQMLSSDSTAIRQSLKISESDPKVLPSQGDTPSFIILLSSSLLEHQMASVCPSLSQSTSQLSKSLGDSQTAMRL